MLLSRVLQPLLRPSRAAVRVISATRMIWTGGRGSNHSKEEIRSTSYLMDALGAPALKKLTPRLFRLLVGGCRAGIARHLVHVSTESRFKLVRISSC